VPEVRDGVGPGPQPLLQAAGRRRSGRPPGRDPPDRPAVLLPGSRLRAEILLRAGRGPDRPLRAEDPAAGRGAREHRGRAGRPGGLAARRGPWRPCEPAGHGAAGHGRPGSGSGGTGGARVDDFAIRRGQHYGTLLIDIETGAPLDLIEGRDAQPLAGWLAAHPGVEVICRDRASAYADGARTGAPGAVQVADRFHLWQNLAKAVEKCAAAHRGCLAEPAPAAAGGHQPETAPDAAPGPPPAGRAAPEPAGKFAERAKRNHALVRQLRTEGHGIREIARHLGWGQHTVQRYDRAATWQELVDGRWKGARASKLDPFKHYLDQHHDGGHGSITRLFREIRALGYDGSYPIVRDYLSGHQPARTPLPPAPPTVRDVTNWLTRHPDSLTEDERPRLKAILDRCPELQAASDQVRAFATMITKLTGQDLPQWITAAREAGLPGLASWPKDWNKTSTPSPTA
jgi:Transposase